MSSHSEADKKESNGMPEKNPFIYPGLGGAFALVVCCFMAWGMATDMTAPLVKIFGSVFSMTVVESSLVQFAYFGAYFCLAIPAAFINNRLGYKSGVIIGLTLAALGGVAFLPASHIMKYGAFLAALFTLAAGLSILETSANPLVMSMGPRGNATRRLNFAQAFNPIGTNLGVLIAAIFMLPKIKDFTPAERAAMSVEQAESVMGHELHAVMGPYIGLAVLYGVLAIAIACVKIPDKRAQEGSIIINQAAGHGSRFMRLFKNKHYSFGVVAQFFNIAAQTCTWTYTLHYVDGVLGVTSTESGYWLQASLIVFLLSRFGMVWVMGRINGPKLMMIMCALGVVFCLTAVISPNILGAVAVVLISACLSLLFPTIYGVALEGLSPVDTKFGAAGLVMSIIGGAIMPIVQGRVVDLVGPSTSFLVPAICFAIILAYAVYVVTHPLKAFTVTKGEDV